MEAPVFHLSMLQKYIDSKQKTKDYALCLGNNSRDSTINNLEKTELKAVVKCFFVILLILILTIF